jgi:ABC-2 type transport system permease protein
LAAPLRRGTVIAGKMLAYMVVVCAQMAVLLSICRVIFQIPLGDSPLGLLLLTLALSLASTGLGMLLGTLARTSKQAGVIGMLVGFLLFFAAGFLNTGFGLTGNVVELVRPTGFMFYLSRLTPHAYALDGYMTLMLEGGGLGDIWTNILALLGFGVVFFVIGLWRFRYE